MKRELKLKETPCICSSTDMGNPIRTHRFGFPCLYIRFFPRKILPNTTTHHHYYTFEKEIFVSGVLKSEINFIDIQNVLFAQMKVLGKGTDLVKYPACPPRLCPACYFVCPFLLLCYLIQMNIC